MKQYCTLPVTTLIGVETSDIFGGAPVVEAVELLSLTGNSSFGVLVLPFNKQKHMVRKCHLSVI